MYPPKERAAKLLAVGESMTDVAKAVQKTERTVKLWLLDKEFCSLLRDNAGGAALRILVGYLTGENEDKDRAMVALALLRMTKTPAPRGNGSSTRYAVSNAEDETDIDGFSEDQLKRLTGDSA